MPNTLEVKKYRKGDMKGLRVGLQLGEMCRIGPDVIVQLHRTTNKKIFININAPTELDIKRESYLVKENKRLTEEVKMLRGRECRPL